uniref:hypothetical protein n=1 Tax=Hylemonella sp. TaxID=2066020 RepID=UPI0035AE3EA2
MKWFLVPCLLLTLPAWAARPFVTDDARLTTAGSCQLESWTRVYQDSREAWALPACNPGGNLEFTAGGGRARSDGQPGTSDYVLQLKTLFRPLETNGWAWGLAVGRVVHPEIQPGPNQLGNTYAYLPASASFAGDRVVLHSNLGWLRDRSSREDRTTWGLGSELYPHPRLALVLETFGDDRAQPFWQTGFRYSVIPNLFQVDTTLGAQRDGGAAGRWLSFGIRWTPARMPFFHRP